jgi:hypothetical protein
MIERGPNRCVDDGVQAWTISAAGQNPDAIRHVFVLGEADEFAKLKDKESKNFFEE